MWTVQATGFYSTSRGASVGDVKVRTFSNYNEARAYANGWFTSLKAKGYSRTARRTRRGPLRGPLGIGGIMKVGDRVIVRINFEDQQGTVERYVRKGFWVVATDRGDVRMWPEDSMRPVTPGT